MIEQLVAEAADCDFKGAPEKRKPKSWLKSVSAFANGIGGLLFFGVADDTSIVGVEAAQADAEVISRLVKERITPLPIIELTAMKENDKDILCLNVKPGPATPYYYKADGVKIGRASCRERV